MEMSQKGIDLLSDWEGIKCKVYLDAASKRTIGIGHLLTVEELVSGVLSIGGKAIQWQDGLSREQVKELLAQDLKSRERTINHLVETPLTQDQFDALVSLVFNIGEGAFAESTVLKRINNGDLDRVPAAFRMWNKVGGKINEGLVERREKEIKLFTGQY